jgi:hypothetical protein
MNNSVSLQKYDLSTILLKVSHISTKCMDYINISYNEDDEYFNDLNNAYLFLSPFSIAYLFSNADENNLNIDLFENFENNSTVFDKKKIDLLDLTKETKKELLYKVNDILNIYLNADSYKFYDIGILDYHSKTKNKIINIILLLIEFLDK